MSEAGIKELKKALKDKSRKINNSKEEARDFLKSSGIMTEKGNFKKGFKAGK
jgi:hypothetical protein